MRRNIAKLVDISDDDTRYVADLRVDYIEGDLVHLISDDAKWEVNFDWKKFIPEFMNAVREHDRGEEDDEG